MPWNSTWPIGSVSVKANRTTGNQNTTYIETTMGNSIVGSNTVNTRDHFWNVSSTLDGHHRFIQSPAFTVGGAAADPVIGTGMDGVGYLKTVFGRVQPFYRNAQSIFQAVPCVVSGSVTITSSSSFVNVVALPDQAYGDIFMYNNIGQFSTVTGFFKSASVTEGWTLVNRTNSGSASALIFGNGGNATDLNLKARLSDGASGSWNYIITYRSYLI